MSSDDSNSDEDSADTTTDHEDADHVIGGNPIETEDVAGATDDELEGMIEQCRSTLDLIDHKLSGDGRLRDVPKEQARCSYIRCQIKTLKLLQDLYEQRELREMRARLERLEDEKTQAQQGDVRIEELIR